MLQLTGHLILISTFVSFSTVFGFDVALFASTGCFSHDVTTREVGEEFAASANVSWLQIRAYKFDNLQPVQLPSEWHQLIVDRIGQSEAGEEGKEIHSLGQPLIWETYVPVDWMRPWDLRGTILFYSILELHHRFCAEFVQSEIFKSYLKQKRPDLVVIDHFLQECFMGAAAILNTTTVKYSNWPLADGYTSSINVPGNPATVPKTGTSFSSLGMDFGNRVRNTIFHGIIAIARHMQTIILKKAYAEWGHPNMDLDDAQALHLLYAGRAEFLVEPIRPISNRIKHFGCPKCKDKTHYEIQRPSFLQLPAIKLQIPNADSQISIVIDVHNRTRLVTNPIGLCTTDCPREKNYTLFNQTSSVIISSELTENLTESEKRYIHALNEFPDLNLLEEGPFVLISFGSVAETKYMPDNLLDEFLHAFASIPLRFVWQTNSEPQVLRDRRRIPDNVVLARWIPIKNVLAHRNLQFVVTHGGVNTINELLIFGVPILGVPLQGDQTSNLQRLSELGAASATLMYDLHTPGTFLKQLQDLQRRLPTIKQRAKKLSEMIASYRQLNGKAQNFWLHWAKRHGPTIQSVNGYGRERKFFELKLRSGIDYLALRELAIWSFVISSTICLLTR